MQSHRLPKVHGGEAQSYKHLQSLPTPFGGQHAYIWKTLIRPVAGREKFAQHIKGFIVKKATLSRPFPQQYKLSGLLVAVAVLTLAVGAQAQTSSASSSGSGYSMYSLNSSYIGLNAGRSNFRLNGGLGGFPNNSRNNAYSLYGGGYFSNNLGVELGYSDFGRVARAGGTTSAEGFNLSMIGKLPLSPAFNLLGRVGTTYGRTEVSSVAASGIPAGRETGFGLSYGLGAEYAFSSTWSAVLQYDEYNLKYVNSGRNRLNTTSIGLRYRF